MRSCGALILGALLSMGAPQSGAASVQVSLSDLDEALQGATASGGSVSDAVQSMVYQRIVQELDRAGLQFVDGALIYEETRLNIQPDSGCNRTEIRSLSTRVELQGDTALELSIKSLHEPVEIALNLAASISATGRAKQHIGFRLGGCQQIAEDNFDIDATGELELAMRIRLELNPIVDTGSNQLVLRPVLALAGELTRRDINVDVDDSILRKLLERILEDQIDDALDDSKLVTELARLQTSVDQSLQAVLDDGQLLVELPDPTDAQVQALYELLSPEGDFLLTRGYLTAHREELLAALVLGESGTVDNLLGDAVLCEAAGLLQVPLPSAPVYSTATNGCAAAVIPDADTPDNERIANSRTWYADAQCQDEISYKATSTTAYCNVVLDKNRLGNAAANPETLGQWTLSPGTQFDIGALPLAGKEQPFTQRVNYKKVQTAQGECALEMRIHTDSPVTDGSASADQNSKPLRALIAFHGGSWRHRSSGALGIEAMAAQFVDAGFVVFAPFYRLIGTSEGNIECNDASLEDILVDASDALDWVLLNAARYGASGKPVLFGQSAGGHLAAVLAVERPADVASAVLFYAPTDFADFARGLKAGEFDTVRGTRILESVLGETLETVDTDAPFVQRNSLPERVAAAEPGTIPPLFLLHGEQDSILPFRQSVRLCDALAGDAEQGPASVQTATADTSQLRQIITCGDNGSELHLIREGEHALDVCVADELCLAGSPESADLTRSSIATMLDWTQRTRSIGQLDRQADQLADDAAPELEPSIMSGASAGNEPGTSRSGSGAGAAGLLWLLAGGVMVCRRIARRP